MDLRFCGDEEIPIFDGQRVHVLARAVYTHLADRLAQRLLEEPPTTARLDQIQWDVKKELKAPVFAGAELLRDVAGFERRADDTARLNLRPVAQRNEQARDDCEPDAAD